MNDKALPQIVVTKPAPPNPIPLALDLRLIPPIYVLPAHFKGGEAEEVKETLTKFSATITSNPSKAKVFIGKVGTKRRAEFELRSRKLTVELISENQRPVNLDEPPPKRRRVERSSINPIPIDRGKSATEEEVVEDLETEDQIPSFNESVPVSTPTEIGRSVFENNSKEDIIWVIKLDWLNESIAAGQMVPLEGHLVYRGKVLERPASSQPKNKSTQVVLSSPTKSKLQNFQEIVPKVGQRILERARTDVSGETTKSDYRSRRSDGHGSRRFEGKHYATSAQHPSQFVSQRAHAHLLAMTTSEYEGGDSEIPPAPPWVQKGIKYSCQRFTSPNGPNEDFLVELKKMRTARTLIDDSIGVRAYSTIIASIAAYPYKLSHPREILRLPGCDTKTAMLYIEWKNTGSIQAMTEYENDPAMKVLRLFYQIWGVGAKTARHLYYEKGWTELDDIIEFGWHELDRVQQIGVKYYDEFLSPIPRLEVESIASIVHEHAVRVRDDRITVTIVGGYRRGKEASGDVDMVVSHPDLEATADLVEDIVKALEDSGWITHTLLMSLNNTRRGQNTLPFRTVKASGAGFDTLDKALVVWQDINWPTRDEDLRKDPSAKNPNIHRRVDIIISPWRTVGCAVMGWTSGTTFQRDLRRYSKAMKGWKFDSSGIRDRNTGLVVEVEGPEGVDGTPEDAEKRVFEGLGLEYIPPEMRCTY